MAKPATLDGYSDQYTVDCERVLVTLLRGLGPWKESVYLVGGLTPRYLVAARPPLVPAHAGTLDVDIVIDLQILADTEAYHTLEDNLKKMGFERAENEKQQKLSWRWQTRTEHGALMVLELLADAPEIAGGKVQPLPTEGTIAALNIPHSSIVFDLHQVTEIQAELLGGNGIATEKIKHANLVSFTCLKSFAFDQRFERKDAHDLIYCIEHAPEGMDAVAEAFKKQLYERGFKRVVRPNKAGCLDQCARGVVVVVYPEQVWYGGVRPEDVEEIISSHIVGGVPVARLVIPDAELTGIERSQ